VVKIVDGGPIQGGKTPVDGSYGFIDHFLEFGVPQHVIPGRNHDHHQGHLSFVVGVALEKQVESFESV